MSERIDGWVRMENFFFRFLFGEILFQPIKASLACRNPFDCHNKVPKAKARELINALTELPYYK
jgi:hypothetical protein